MFVVLEVTVFEDPSDYAIYLLLLLAGSITAEVSADLTISVYLAVTSAVAPNASGVVTVAAVLDVAVTPAVVLGAAEVPSAKYGYAVLLLAEPASAFVSLVASVESL